MRVTVLGKSPSWQDAGGACSGYLVQEEGFSMLLDCGNGVFAKLRDALDYLALDAVLISHLHADHFLDLIPFSYALLNSPRRSGDANAKGPSLHGPAGAGELLRRVAGAWGPEELVEQAFALREYAEDETLALGPLNARFCEVPHYTQTFAVEITAPTGERFVFGADCGPNAQLAGFASGSELLMLESTLLEPDEHEPPGHLSPAEAGALARAAGVRRLVLTHFSDELDPERLRREAEAAFGGEVELAREGAVFRLGTRCE